MLWGIYGQRNYQSYYKFCFCSYFGYRISYRILARRSSLSSKLCDWSCWHRYCLFITPPITNAIMGISVPYEETTVTLSQYIVEMLKQNADIAALIENNPNLSTLIERLPSAVGNVVVFLVVSALVMLVLYIVYKIIAVTCLKRKEDQKCIALGAVLLDL